MQLDPGPIPTITTALVDQTIEDPGNAAFVMAFDPTFAPTLAGMDAAIDATAAIDDVLPDDGNTDDLNAAGAILDAIGNPDTSAIQQVGDAQLFDLSGKMVLAFGVTPSEAFQAVPDQLLTPGGQPVTPSAASSTASIQNLTRPGDTNFYPGDQYEIDVSLAPVPGGGGAYAGVGVTMYTSQGTTAWPPNVLCLTDEYGRIAEQGTFGPGDVGLWVAVILPGSPATAAGSGAGGGLATTYQFGWTVTAGPGAAAPDNAPAPAGAAGLVLTQTVGSPCPQSNITVQLANVTNVGSPNFTSGDSWTLAITGPANSDVTIWAMQNGVPLGSEILGQTDSFGNFYFDGSMSDPYIGNWVENYAVGDEIWTGTLVFYVTPAPPPNVGGGVI